jgi:hypothetical protein
MQRILPIRVEPYSGRGWIDAKGKMKETKQKFLLFFFSFDEKYCYSFVIRKIGWKKTSSISFMWKQKYKVNLKISTRILQL